MNKSELLKLVKTSFEFNAKENVLHACSDGIIFTEKNKNAAKNHAARSKDDVEVITFNRNEVFNTSTPEENSEKPLSKMNLTELKSFANKKGIELEATLKADIVKEITTKLVAKSESESSDSPEKSTGAKAASEEE